MPFLKHAVGGALLAASLAAAGAASAQTADPMLSRNLAATCANCHGTNGQAMMDKVKPLAGRAAADIEKTMKDFKSGQKPGSIMHQISKGYTDAQIALVADYFAKQPAN